jgi:hypothetical protein
MTPEVGVTYEITLSDGGIIRVRFEGFGPYMSSQWRDLATDEVLPSLPPYRSIRPVPGALDSQPRLSCVDAGDGFQTQVNDMPRTGDDAKDFHSGCVVIQAAIKAALAAAGVPESNVSWAEPAGSSAPLIGTFTVTANEQTMTLEVPRKQVIASYERVGNPNVSEAIQDLVLQLTK